jgi:hypothetical protein
VLQPQQLLLSQEDSFQTECLYTTQEGCPFTTHSCPVILPAYNFLAWTAQKTPSSVAQSSHYLAAGFVYRIITQQQLVVWLLA